MFQRIWNAVRRAVWLLFGVLPQQKEVDREFKKALEDVAGSQQRMHEACVKLQKARANVHARAVALTDRAGEHDVQGEGAAAVATAEARG